METREMRISNRALGLYFYEGDVSVILRYFYFLFLLSSPAAFPCKLPCAAFPRCLRGLARLHCVLHALLVTHLPFPSSKKILEILAQAACDCYFFNSRGGSRVRPSLPDPVIYHEPPATAVNPELRSFYYADPRPLHQLRVLINR